MVLNGLLSMIFSYFKPTDRIVKNPILNPQKIYSGKFLKIPLNISFNSSFIKSILNIKRKNYYAYFKISGYIDKNKALFRPLNGEPAIQIRCNFLKPPRFSK